MKPLVCCKVCYNKVGPGRLDPFQDLRHAFPEPKRAGTGPRVSAQCEKHMQNTHPGQANGQFQLTTLGLRQIVLAPLLAQEPPVLSSALPTFAPPWNPRNASVLRYKPLYPLPAEFQHHVPWTEAEVSAYLAPHLPQWEIEAFNKSNKPVPVAHP